MVLFIKSRDAFQHYDDYTINNQNEQKDIKKFAGGSVGPVDYLVNFVFPTFFDFQNLLF